MAKIKITTEDGQVIKTQGQMTVTLDKTTDGDLICTGSLAVHEYIEAIDKIESSRFSLDGVDVYREVFGTNDFNVLYQFQLTDEGNFSVKNETLSKEEIESILKEMYINEDCNKWE